MRKYSKKYNLATKQKFPAPSEPILSALPASIIAILFSVNTIHIPVLLYLHLIIISSQQIVEFYPNIIHRRTVHAKRCHLDSDRALVGAERSRVRIWDISLADRATCLYLRSEAENISPLTRFSRIVIGCWALISRPLHGVPSNESTDTKYVQVKRAQFRIRYYKNIKNKHF